MIKHVKPAVTGCALLAVVFLYVQPAHTESQGFYFGTSLGLEDVETNYERVFDSDADRPPASLNSILSDGEGNPYNLSVFTGYRLQMRRDGLWMGLETETTIRRNKLQSKLVDSVTDLDTSSYSSGNNEQWSYRTTSDNTVLLKMGTVVAPMGLIDFSGYMLAGLRQSHVEFSRNLPLCQFVAKCSESQSQRRVVDTVKPRLNHWLVGAGIERSIGFSTGIQFETRYSQSREKKIDELPEEAATAAMLNSKTVDLSLRLIRYF